MNFNVDLQIQGRGQTVGGPPQAAARSVEMLDERPSACANGTGRSRFAPPQRKWRGLAEEAGVLFNLDAAMLGRAVSRLAAAHLLDSTIVQSRVSAS